LNIILNNEDKEDKIPIVAKEFYNTFRNLKKNITKIQEKFFNEIPYENANKIFDDQKSNYFKLTEVNNQISDILKNDEKWFIKYPNILENLNKLFALINSSFEKFENKENETEKENLPLPEWQKITDKLNNELEKVVEIQDENENIKKELKNQKIQYSELKNNFESI
jgi:DNA repair ATPase RecN